MSSLVEIKTNQAWIEYCDAIPSTTLQILYFKADWAAPCKQMTTVLSTLALAYPPTDPPTTSWVMMDAEEVMDVSDSFNVTAVPFLVLRRGNTVLQSISGSDPTKVRLAIQKYATASPGVTAIPTPSTSGSGSEARSITTSSAQNLPKLDGDLVEGAKETKEELHARLAKLVKAAPVMLFMKGTPSAPQCGFSRQLVKLLRDRSVKYGFFNILADDDVRQGLKEFADWPTFPQLWAEGELVGGLDIAEEEFAKDPNFLKEYSVAKIPAASSTV